MNIKNARHPGQHIAVVGSGIAGLASAYLLSTKHQVTLFEADQRMGGHAHAVDVTLEGKTCAVDTGFLVLNERTYPNLLGLFKELQVATCPSDMSFSVSLGEGCLEWSGTSLNTVFGQRRNILNPDFLGMLLDLLRFNRRAESNLLMARQRGISLGDLLHEQGYGDAFRHHYLLPMAACIWSSPSQDVLRYPAASFLQFCLNHGLLQINGRPRWLSVVGSSRSYVDKLLTEIAYPRTCCPVARIERDDQGVWITSKAGREHFDAVVLAAHAPDSLAMFQDADADESSVLRSVRYQKNQAWLHTDVRWMPAMKKLWAAWNYRAEQDQPSQPVCVSYWLNKLQPLPFQTPVFVTLNPGQEPEGVLGQYTYDHPLFDAAALDAQRRLPGLQGRRHTYYAGAWTRYGFHEDGLRSALQVAKCWGIEPAWAQL
ncbi:MAG: NAD(P)-binding protein [Pseudomonadales bacterium]|nr:NAD(P)-binding protein [Pseudomonadales bacterium]